MTERVYHVIDAVATGLVGAVPLAVVAYITTEAGAGAGFVLFTVVACAFFVGRWTTQSQWERRMDELLGKNKSDA